MSLWERLRALRNRPAELPEPPLPYVDPLRAGRHPFQTYILALCVVAGLPYLFGHASSDTVAAELPNFIAVGWGVSLLMGSVLALVGSYWSRSIADALTMERMGLSLTGWAALVYGLCIIGARSGYAPLFVVCTHLGFVLLRIPIKGRGWSEKKTRVIEDALTVTGLVVMAMSLLFLLLSPALGALAGAAVVLGFGGSCLRRSRDIGRIFHRAMTIDPPPVLREGEVT